MIKDEIMITLSSLDASQIQINREVLDGLNILFPLTNHDCRLL